MLVELSVMEQRYQAVLAVVQDGETVIEMAGRVGVSRQMIHAWIRRYEAQGLASWRIGGIGRASVRKIPPRSNAEPGRGTSAAWF